MSVAPVHSELSPEQLDHYAGGLPDIGEKSTMYVLCPSCGTPVYDIEAGVAACCPTCGQPRIATM